MLYITYLLILTVFFSLLLDKFFKIRFSGKSSGYDKLKEEYQNLLLENEKIKKSNFELQKDAEGTIALYDVAKDISKSLDEEKVFSLFKDRLTRYIQVKDCLFLKQKEDLSKIKDATGLPLILNKNVIGYLAVSGLREEEKDKFHILGQQFLLGLERALLYKKVQELSITDSLTQIYSRRYFLEKLEEEISRAKKFQLSFAFLMVDIDHFKKINDNYGHLVGDVILKEVAKAIKENVRQIDFMGRYGGEELSIILTETNKQDAGLITERIRQAVESRQIKAYDETLNTTVSIGVSVYPADATNSMALIDKADQALYRAKLSGRNKVCFSS